MRKTLQKKPQGRDGYGNQIKVKAPGGIGYIEANGTDNMKLIKYLQKDRALGLVGYNFEGACMFRMEHDKDIEIVKED